MNINFPNKGKHLILYQIFSKISSNKTRLETSSMIINVTVIYVKGYIILMYNKVLFNASLIFNFMLNPNKKRDMLMIINIESEFQAKFSYD